MSSEELRDRFATRAASQRDTEILDASLARFAADGCFSTSVDQVIADVGIGKGTLYRHYASREDLFKGTLRSGLDALAARCQDVWQAHSGSPAAGFRAVIAELAAMNQRRDAISPATLSRLECGCQWMGKSGAYTGHLEAVLVPFIQTWQAARLFDEAADPSWIAAAMVALVNSPAIVDRLDLKTDGVDRLVDLVGRLFADRSPDDPRR